MVLRPSIAEDIEGDLTEMFHRDVTNGNIAKARLRFSINTLRLFRPGIIKQIGYSSLYIHPSPMFKNYFITSVRSLMRNKGFSMINIIGLAVGLATFSLISLYVYHEMSFDRYHKNADRIVRIVENLRTENEMLFQSTSSPPMGPRMLKDFPEVENYVRFQNWSLLGQRNGNSYYEPDCYLADSTVFDIFSFNLITGDRKTRTRTLFHFLTELMAKKYFGNEDPRGPNAEDGLRQLQSHRGSGRHHLKTRIFVSLISSRFQHGASTTKAEKIRVGLERFSYVSLATRCGICGQGPR